MKKWRFYQGQYVFPPKNQYLLKTAQFSSDLLQFWICSYTTRGDLVHQKSDISHKKCRFYLGLQVSARLQTSPSYIPAISRRIFFIFGYVATLPRDIQYTKNQTFHSTNGNFIWVLGFRTVQAILQAFFIRSSSFLDMFLHYQRTSTTPKITLFQQQMALSFTVVGFRTVQAIGQANFIRSCQFLDMLLHYQRTSGTPNFQIVQSVRTILFVWFIHIQYSTFTTSYAVF